MIKKILVHLDPSRPQLRARRLAVDLAHRLGADLLALFVVDERVLPGGRTVHAVQDALDQMTERSADEFDREIPEGTRVERLVGYGDTAKTVAHYVRKEGADLVVSGGYPRAAYEHVPFGSLLTDLVARVQTSILLMRDYHTPPREGGPVHIAFGPDKGSVRTVYALEPLAKAYSSDFVIHSSGLRRHAAKMETILMGARAHEDRLGVRMRTEYLVTPPWARTWYALARYADQSGANFLAVGRNYRCSAIVGEYSPLEKLVVHTRTPLFIHYDE